MPFHHTISNAHLTLADLSFALATDTSLSLSSQSQRQIVKCRTYLDHKLANSSAPIYGINTGFGSLYNRNIPKDQLEQLQENLVMSHACGAGADVPQEMCGSCFS